MLLKFNSKIENIFKNLFKFIFVKNCIIAKTFLLLIKKKKKPTEKVFLYLFL